MIELKLLLFHVKESPYMCHMFTQSLHSLDAYMESVLLITLPLCFVTFGATGSVNMQCTEHIKTPLADNGFDI